MAGAKDFQVREYAHHAAIFRQLEGVKTGHQNQDVMLLPEYRRANLNPSFAGAIEEFFAFSGAYAQRIGWHTRANHGASSQVCCVNFLFPLADKPELLSQWVDHVMGISGAQVQKIDARCGQDWYLTFEWFPDVDYLNEANSKGERPRGANSTSVDAAVAYVANGRRCLLLIEWKYTESYAATRAAKHARGDATRMRRYTNLWRRPHGPIRSDARVELHEFFLDPWYQLLRQQMLAYHCETDPLSEYDVVTVLHISPDANVELKRAKGPLARFGDDVFQAFTSLLHPELQNRFRPVATGWAFSPFLDNPQVTWSEWLKHRYPSLLS